MNIYIHTYLVFSHITVISCKLNFLSAKFKNCFSCVVFSPFLSLSLSLFGTLLPEPERTASEIVVTWSTRGLPPDAASSIVEYGLEDHLGQRAEGTAVKFVDGGPKQMSQYIHRVRTHTHTGRRLFSSMTT